MLSDSRFWWGLAAGVGLTYAVHRFGIALPGGKKKSA